MIEDGYLVEQTKTSKARTEMEKLWGIWAPGLATLAFFWR